MWDRKAVLAVHQKYNGASREEARCLLRWFRKGSTIGNEGCLLTCLAMVLHLLDQEPKRKCWSPKKLNGFAQDSLYYTRCGLSMVTLYADLVCEASNGEVQLLIKEEYLSGEPGWPRTYASSCMPLRAYRALSPQDRQDIVMMIKIGTYDDAVASHFVLVDQTKPGSLRDDDFVVLDPAKPLDSKKASWKLSDCCKHLREDGAIREEWRKAGIHKLQIAGAWVFARWRSSRDRALGAAFLQSLGSLLAGNTPSHRSTAKRAWA